MAGARVTSLDGAAVADLLKALVDLGVRVGSGHYYDTLCEQVCVCVCEKGGRVMLLLQCRCAQPWTRAGPNMKGGSPVIRAGLCVVGSSQADTTLSGQKPTL